MYLLAVPLGCPSTDDATLPHDTTDTTADTGTGEDGPTLLSGPSIDLPASLDVHLVRILALSTDVPTRLTVVLDDGAARREIAFADLATDHRRPLLGLLADHTYTAAITLTDEAGGTLVLPETSFSVGPLTLPVPTLELLKHEPTAEPGITLLPLSTDDKAMIVGVDLDGRPVWGFDNHAKAWALSQAPGGEIGMLRLAGLWKLAPDGTWLSSLNGPESPFNLPVAVEGFNHEATLLPDGSFLSLHNETFNVANYPLEDLSGTEPARIFDDEIYEIDTGGNIVHMWSMATILDPERVGYGSWDGDPYDWGHGNAVSYDALDDALVASLRHQDAVVKIDRTTGSIRWILGNHDGWGPDFAPYLLEPVGTPFAWPYHQHAPMVHPEDSSLVVLFDNGNEHRTTPYSATPEPGLYSRVVAYRIDEQAKTIQQEWEYIEGLGVDVLYTQALGNADFLPTTDHVLATFPYLRNENGVQNTDLMRGDKSVRAIEIDPVAGTSVWDLRIYGPFQDDPEGWQADRIIRVASLYGNTATERLLE